MANKAGNAPVKATAQQDPEKTISIKFESGIRKDKKTGEALVIAYTRRPRTLKPKVALTLENVLKQHMWAVGHYGFYFDISPGTVRAQVRAGTSAPYIKVGKQIRFKRDQVLAWEAERATA